MRPIANWKIADEYPKWRTASLQRFAWEFLRRNPNYQADWQEYLAACRRLVPDFDPHVLRDWDAKLLEHDDYFRCEPPRLEDESEAAWISRGGCGTRTPLRSWYAKKWGLTANLPDPFYSYYEKHGLGYLAIAFEKSATKVEIPSKHWEYFDRNKYPFRCEPKEAVAFDYSRPIEPQIIAARDYLLKQQQRRIKAGIVDAFPNKIPRKELVIYLRMLDADASGIQAKDIAAALYPNEDDSYPERRISNRVSKDMKVAKQWRDEWYRLLPSIK